MKIYFDGCSCTYGQELINPIDERYSKLVANHFGAEDYNKARCGGSNRRIIRNLLSHNMSEFDMVVIQMTYKWRTEFYKDGRWKRFGLRRDFHTVAPSGFSLTKQKFVEDKATHPYVRDMYSDEFGEIDEKIMYHAIKNILKDKKHFIFTIQHGTELPIYAYNDPIHLRASIGHPNKEGHKFLADIVIRGLTTPK